MPVLVGCGSRGEWWRTMFCRAHSVLLSLVAAVKSVQVPICRGVDGHSVTINYEQIWKLKI